MPVWIDFLAQTTTQQVFVTVDPSLARLIAVGLFTGAFHWVGWLITKAIFY